MTTTTTRGTPADATNSSAISTPAESQPQTSVTSYAQPAGTPQASHTAERAEPPSASLRDTRPADTRPVKESLREQKKAKARELILNCAQQLINTAGYTETKMRDVAGAAGMSYQTLYNYFPTKGLILQELLTRDLVNLRHGPFDTQHSAEPITTKLRDFAKDYIAAIAPDDRHLWKEVCAELLKVTSHHSCLLALLDERALTKLRTLLADAQFKGELNPHIASDTLAEVLYSLLDSMLMRYLVNESLSRPNILGAISTQIRFIMSPYLR